MRVEYRDDGTKLIKFSPIEGLPFYGDWLDVLLARGAANEVTAVDAITGKAKIDPVTGETRTSIETPKGSLQRAIVNDDGETGILCIGCGEPIYGELHHGSKGFGVSRNKRKIKFDTIRIGGFVQFPEIEETADKNVFVRRWKVRPVHKEGIGCSKCRAIYAEIVTETDRINRARTEYSNLLAGALEGMRRSEEKATVAAKGNRCTHGVDDRFCAVCLRNQGKKQADVSMKLPGPLTPFIDVFAPKDALDGAQSLEPSRS